MKVDAKKKNLVLLRVSLLVLVFGSQLRAQAVYGNIVGSVSDPSGAAVPGANITITDVVRNVTVSTTSNESGNFAQRHLIAGAYRVRIEKNGFQSVLRDNVIVSVDSDTQLLAQLKVGDVTQTMEVSAESSLLNTERAEVSTNFDQRTVNDLPALGRRFNSFELITPGYQTTGNQPIGEDPQGSINKNVNGQRGAGSSETLDGTDNHSSVQGTVIVMPTLESVVDAKVATENYGAEFAGSSAAVSAQTRSGTNQIHGSVFEYLRNDHMQARDPFAQAVPIGGRTIPVTQWNQFGGSFGGALKKDKLFYFADYQGTRRNLGGSLLLRTPTAAERTGDLSDLSTPSFDPDSGATPAQRSPFPNNRIPLARLSPQALNLLSFMPLPNVANVAGEQPNFNGSGGFKLTENTANTRWDYYQNDKSHWFGRYSFSRFSEHGDAGYGGDVAGGPAAAKGTFAGTSSVWNQSVAVGNDYVVNPNLLTDFRFGFYRQRQNPLPLGYGGTPDTNAGIPGLNTSLLTSGMSGLTVGGTGGFTFGTSLAISSCNCPMLQVEKQFQGVNNWTVIKGNHTVKYGADIRRAYNHKIPSDSTRAGAFAFNAATTQGPTGGGLGLATLLLGDVSGFQRFVSTAMNAVEEQNRFFFFGQDTWRATRKLTLTYGLRWEIWRPENVNGQGQGGFVDLSTGEVRTAGENGVGLNFNVAGTFKALAPRTGIAYQLTPKTVIRAGYGRSFDIGVFGNMFGSNVTQNLPVLAYQNLSPAQAYQPLFTLAAGPPSVNPATVLAAQPKGPNGLPILPNGINANILLNKIVQPTVDQWNVAIQQQLPGGLVAEVAYVGNSGRHNGGNYDCNTATIVGYGTLTLNQRKPYYQEFGWTQTLKCNANTLSTFYDGLQAKVEKRFSHNLALLAHYTWGRAFSSVGTYFSVDPKLAYGPLAAQHQQEYVLAPMWEVPVGKGQHFLSNSRVGDLVLGGWQMNGIYTWMTGLPFTPTYQNASADVDTGPTKPNVVGNPYASNPSQYGWFNTSPVVLTANGQVGGPWQRPQPGTFGTIGLNRLFGPRFAQLDWSMFKKFTLTERFNLQFRVEAYNLANHTNLGQPTASVDSPGTAGRIFATSAYYVPRQLQLGLRLGF